VDAPDGPRQISRSRLPLPPVPAANRRSGSAPVRSSAPAAPHTSAAPFRAVPAPEPRVPTSVPASVGAPLDGPARLSGKAAPAVVPQQARPWHDDDSALVSTGPGISRAGRPSPPSPRGPRAASVASGASPAYGDWTKPSRSGDVAVAPGLELEPLNPLRGRAAAPATTAIPERSVAGRRRSADAIDDAPVRSTADDASRGPVTDPGTGPVVGGRAALRAERQAADAARRKAEKQRGGRKTAVADDEDGARKPRRVVKGLVAMTVVVLGVLGVYSFISPDTKDAAPQTPVAPTTAQSAAAPSQPLPALQTEPVAVEPTVAAPVRVPVTVLNATRITGLAAKISGAVVASGWESPGVGTYKGSDVAASTVFFTAGDENQRLAALQLMDQFPQLQGPTPRFFEVPADVPAPGLVIVAAGDWQP
jgi:hypothetical protein